MITFDNVTIRYGDDGSPVVRDVDLRVEEGELLLVVGPTGVGKSTLLWAVNGLVPHFTGGHLSGRVTVAGRDTRTHKPRELADIVGVVGQDPTSGFVTDTVEEELAYGMEQLALAPAVMRKRVEETLDVLGIAGLRDRPLATLSGGEAQRVAFGTVLTAHPRILVLDEPTSALDPVAAEEVLAAVTRLVHDLGLTVVMAEHRLERVVQYADRVAEVRAGGTVAVGAPGRIMAMSDVAPPVVELGRLARWEPLPLSVRDARRVAGPLRHTVASRLAPAPAPTPPVGSSAALSARDLVVRYGPTIAVRQLGVALAEGEIVALMGRNGSGKSSLLWALQGSGPSQGGAVTVGGADPRRRSAVERRRLVGLVPQTPSDLLYLDRVADELAQADRDTSSGAGSARSVLDRLLPGVGDEIHPRDLSEGQRLALVLAIQLVARPRVVLLDEPTRGLDYRAKRTLSAMLGELAGAGTAVVVATHDVEFAAATATRVVVMAAGEIVADGPAAEVLAGSPAFAPQVAKILSPVPVLTVEGVRSVLEGTP